MSTAQHPRSTAWLPSNGTEQPHYTQNAAEASNGPALSHSSPWALALAISITIWLAAAWLFLTFTN